MKKIIYKYPITKDLRLLFFYEKLAVINSKNIPLASYLLSMGINNICIYGYGMIGELLDMHLNDSKIVSYIYDKNETICANDPRVIKLDDLIQSEIPILISPINNVKEITESLMKKGVSRKRILSAYFVIDRIYDYINCDCKEKWLVNDKMFLITGASFKNKGAQSMLFVTMNELYRKYPTCKLFFAPENDISDYSEEDIGKYKFTIIRGGISDYSDLYDILPNIDAVIDISGYSVTSEGYNAQIRTTLKCTANYDIPLYMMPQSFGPFDFGFEDKLIFYTGLHHAKIIYAREKKGKEMLEEHFGLKNVLEASDIVISCKNIDYKNVYREKIEFDDIYLETENNVAIVPNVRNYEFGSKQDILKCYKGIIDTLLKNGKTVYIIPHSNDEKACMDIYDMYSFKKNVSYVGKIQDCLEFERLIKNFDFIIGSRFHALVHALKNGIPCIALGWEIKYKNILSMFNQEKYCFNVREGLDNSKVISSVENMIMKYKDEMKIIQQSLIKEEKYNCFDSIGE